MKVFGVFLKLCVIVAVASESGSSSDENYDLIPDEFKNGRMLDHREINREEEGVNYDSTIQPADISQFAKKLSMKRNTSLKNVVASVNQLIVVAPTTMFKESQKQYNATDEILDNLDLTIKENALKYDSYLADEYHLMVQTFHIKTNSIAGLLVDKKKNTRLIYRNESFASVLDKDFIVVLYLPRELIEQVERSVAEPTAAISVFFKESLFMEVDDEHETKTIYFGVLFPGFNEEFETPVKIVYQVDKFMKQDKTCAYWKYGTNIKGSWEEDAPSSSCGSIEICDYYHVTHFGMLMSDSSSNIKPLEIINLVGCCLSLIGIIGIFLTGILFPKWRTNKGNIILMNYALATLIEICTLYISGAVKENSHCDQTWCFLSGVFLHYAVLAQFAWVLVISYLQYKRYVQVIGAPTSRVLLKSCLVGWCGPLLIVIPMMFFKDSYVKNEGDLCYPEGVILYVGVVLPILIVVLINIVIFCLIVRSIFSNKFHVPRLADNVAILRLRLIVLLFFQLGICWIFAFMIRLGIVFAYLFVITASLQGFVVFLLFIAFNEPSRACYRKLFGIKDTRVTSMSTTSTSGMS